MNQMTLAGSRTQQAWDVLSTVLDPEVPALSLRDLGIVRDVREQGAALDVVLTPTYSGCPATELIEQQARAAVEAAVPGPVRVLTQRAPAWTTDWISADGRRKLREYGIAPPGQCAPVAALATVRVTRQIGVLVAIARWWHSGGSALRRLASRPAVATAVQNAGASAALCSNNGKVAVPTQAAPWHASSQVHGLASSPTPDWRTRKVSVVNAVYLAALAWSTGLLSRPARPGSRATAYWQPGSSATKGSSPAAANRAPASAASWPPRRPRPRSSCWNQRVNSRKGSALGP